MFFSHSSPSEYSSSHAAETIRIGPLRKPRHRHDALRRCRSPSSNWFIRGDRLGGQQDLALMADGTQHPRQLHDRERV